ncbi:CRISPR-associated DxTHG motif protein [Pseudomonas sp. SID14000]|uniref:CRISPR-associated DxTHG motif protein n=1 Tax=Pseudomonas sp. SID14000 TaxID=1986221 RepID=UPI0011224963
MRSGLRYLPAGRRRHWGRGRKDRGQRGGSCRYSWSASLPPILFGRIVLQTGFTDHGVRFFPVLFLKALI